MAEFINAAYRKFVSEAKFNDFPVLQGKMIRKESRNRKANEGRKES